MKTRWIKSFDYTLLAAICAGSALFFHAVVKASKPNEIDPTARGKYLVALAGCSDCHTPLKLGPNGPEPDAARYLAGHPEDVKLPPPPTQSGPWFASTAGMTAWAGPWGVSYASNLTPDTNTGLGIWTESMFIQAMRTGKHMGTGRDILPPMPWRNFAGVSDDDLRAIFAYLRSLPPVSNHVPDPLGPNGRVAFE